MLGWILAWAAAAASLSAQAEAPRPDPSLLFGARENVEFVALSPDGTQLAYAIPSEGQGSRLMTVTVGSSQPRHVISVDGRRQRLSSCDWVSNRRLVCTVFAVADAAGLLVNASRLIALDVDGSNVKSLGEPDSADQVRARLYGGNVIDWLPGQDNQVLLQQQFIPEGRAGTLLNRTEDGLGVAQIDTISLRTRQVEDAHPSAINYLSDGRGTVRIMSVQQVRGDGMATSLTNHFYRRASSSDWHPLGDYDSISRRGLWPVAVDAERNAVYVFERQDDGRAALVRISLDGRGTRDLTIAHPHVDVDDLLRIGRAGRVVGASYATDRRQTIYFDPQLQRIAQQLSRALPNTPLINFVGASEDERKLLVLAGSDTDPGTYYVLDRESRQLVQVMRSRPELDGVQLAAVEAVSYPAADGTRIPGYLTLPPGGARRGLPAIVMPHGGPGSRDEWGFDWLAQYFANRGYAVLQPNFRGSAGYGNEWFQTNGFQSWNVAIGDVNDAGRWLVSEGIADPAKLAILGWSYGGYAALQSGVVDPDLYKAVIAIAPVTDLQETKDEWRRFSNRANIRDYIGSGPHVAAGSPARHAASIRAPVLLFHGEMDRNVGIRQSRLMRDRLRDAGKRVELIEFAALDHQLEDSAARRQMLKRSDEFLRQVLGL